MTHETTEIKKWRGLAVLWGVLGIGVIGWGAMIYGAIKKKADGASWGIFGGTLVGTLLLFVGCMAAVEDSSPSSAVSGSSASDNRSVSSEPAPRSEPANSFGNGDHLVGIDIQPGTYRANCDGGFAGACYWARHSKQPNQFGMTEIVNDIKQSGGQAIVDIYSSDYRFESQGFERWQKVN